MNHQALAKVYAKSVLQLSSEKKIDLAGELTKFTEVVNASNDLENLLFIEVFSPEEKLSVCEPIFKSLGLSDLTVNFLSFLISEKRIHVLPFIFKEVIVIDDHEKGFLRGTIEGVEDGLDKETRDLFTSYLKKRMGKEPKLEYKKSSNVSAGYKVSVGDLQLDASIESQLNRFRKDILGE